MQTQTITPNIVTDELAEQLLHDLVSIPSPSYHEAQAVQHLVDWMATHGYDNAFIDEAGNAIGIRGHGTRQIVLLGHIDTFGGFPNVHIQERLLYGRGSVDAKSSLCAFAVAGARAELPPDTQLIVIGAVEEECPTSKGARYAMTQYQPHACIIGEPSNWDRITLGYKGRLVLEWAWHGALAHSASETLTPAEHAVHYWQAVQGVVAQFNQDKTRIFERLDVTLQELNTAQDGSFGRANMVIGFRLPPTLTPTEVLALMPATEANLHPFAQEFTYQADKDNALTRAFRGAIRAQGGTPAFVHKTGTSDMNVVGRTWHCPMVAYGAGDSALDHTPNEHISLDEYLQAVHVLEKVLREIKL
jgi:[amino group carrier protein]-lysine/ornithine hydrolase